MTIRFWLLTTSYRQPINFTKEIIDSAQNSLDRLNNAYFKAEEALESAKEIELKDSEKDLLQILTEKENEFVSVMEDDLNTADAITVLFDLAKFINTNISADSSKAFVEKTFEVYSRLYEVLGLLAKKKESEVDETFIEEKIAERNAAKKNKDFATADKIRDDLKEMGIILKDTREGTKWEIG